jgi:prepilin-type N-terminal cleavage/methylation domain-containing protein
MISQYTLAVYGTICIFNLKIFSGRAMYFNKNLTGTQGFTLIELAMVIVIIGLLIAGITVGTELVQQAEMTSLISDMKSFQNAYNNFNKRYRAVPGDMDNAATYFEGCAATNTNCNGNGDGIVSFADTLPDESYSAWRELALGNLIAFPIVIIPNNWAGVEIVGSTVPASQRKNSGYIMAGASTFFGYDGASNYANSPWSDNTTNAVFFGKPSSIGLGNSSLKPEEAFNIDVKIDDGVVSAGVFYGAQTGRYRSITGVDTNSACVNSDNYNLTLKEIACVSGLALN